MDWDNARIFLAVARSGQFLAAARQLGLDHATVARRVSALEKALGSALFERRTTGCVPTPAGERFLASAERIEAEMLSAQADLAATGLDVSGTVRIGAPDGFGTLFLSPRLGKLASQHPGLIIQLVPVPRAFSLSKREADIAITIDRPEAGRLAIRKLTDYTLHLYAARSYLSKHGEPESREALKAHQLVTYVQDQLFSPALNFMPDLFGPDYRRLECVSAVGQDAAVQAGAGIGILHDYHAARNAGLKMVMPDLVFRRTYWLATHLDTQASLRIRTVADFIVAEVQAHRALFEPEAAARQA
ncbi:MAG: LysR family transcriptional regulator [Methylobacterium sp.]|jgi:DNA-binding transcriptional LysR family regulator|nr:LysR family transcriptional regulator [Methylobacterium sp.]MCE2932555.1 LysR family transcriptional regulator [Hyphomicrobiales bacterium]MCA3655053.1 LysR family transcriptional regulator [Methylobacterium sp.]MCA3659234.1 LysR family transcriptional regulator [Methylobacterium sp.]MCA3660878.1 LysR family transcriptional regulator [Methylobacterium sp.]